MGREVCGPGAQGLKYTAHTCTSCCEHMRTSLKYNGQTLDRVSEFIKKDKLNDLPN